MGKILKMTDGFGQVRTLGALNGQTLRTWRSEEKHLYRKLNAWCFDKDAFNQHEEIKLFIIESENERRYLAPRDAFDKYATTINWAGHGEQLALPLEYWQEFKEH
jgi:hypothetical protein